MLIAPRQDFLQMIKILQLVFYKYYSTKNTYKAILEYQTETRVEANIFCNHETTNTLCYFPPLTYVSI